MSRRRGAPMPASSAGLIVFYEQDVSRLKLRPELIVALSVGLIIVSIALLAI